MKMKKSKRIVVSLFSAALLAGAANFGANKVAEQLSPQTHTVQAASYINNYINQKKFGNPAITTYKSTFTQYFGYRNGVGKPEGVVVHETANSSSTIDGEVSYMMNNWGSIYSYVHAFVDHSRIINIHNTNYGVWGAGPVANARYIQIELVREHTTDNFARSVNNDAYYVAYLLKQYGLTPKLADNSGSGTVWSHNAVTKYLGGTTHVDPTTYFATWGYDMNQFFALVQQKYGELGGTSSYDTLKTSTNVSKRATIHGNSSDSVYYLVNNQFQPFGSTSDYNNQTYDVYKTATTKNGNTMALIGSNGKGALWLKTSDLEYVSTDKVTSQVNYNGTGHMNSNVSTYYYVGGGFTAADRFGNQDVTIKQKITTQNGKIYYLINTTRGARWIANYDLSNIKQGTASTSSSSSLSTDKMVSKISYSANVKFNGGQTYWYSGGLFSKGEVASAQNVTVRERIQTASGKVYYLAKTNLGERWINAAQATVVNQDTVKSTTVESGTATLKANTPTYYLMNNSYFSFADYQKAQSLKIKKKAITKAGKTYYLLQKDGGDWRWVNSGDVKVVK